MVIYDYVKNKYTFQCGNSQYVFDYVTNFDKKGFAPFCQNGLWGIIKKNGKIIVPPSYYDIDVYHNDLARARGSDGYFYIDRKGQVKLGPYSGAMNFVGHKAWIKEDAGNWIWIDTEGKKIVEETFEYVQQLNNFIYEVYQNGCIYYATLSGNIFSHKHEALREQYRINEIRKEIFSQKNFFEI